jgi:hypothetical protein
MSRKNPSIVNRAEIARTMIGAEAEKACQHRRF